MVNWIAELPKYEIKYSTKKPTNKNVKVTLEIESGYNISNNDGKDFHVFTENGTFEFQFTDSKGNIGSIPVTVDWIDKTPPTAELKYVKENGKVIVQVVNPSEEITFKEGNGIYEFTKNGSYDIIFYDKVGNQGKLTAIIDLSNHTGSGNKPPSSSKPSTSKPTKPTLPDKNLSNVEENKNHTDTNDKGDQNHTITNPSQYKKYTASNIVVKIPSNVVTTEATFQVDSFDLSEELKKTFQDISECYDLYLADRNFERVKINSTMPIKINIKLTANKKFVGVYEIVDSNTVKPVHYTKSGDNIEITAHNLGKYVVSYEDLKEEKTTNNVLVSEREKHGNYIFWLTIGSLAVILVLAIGIFKDKYREVK